MSEIEIKFISRGSSVDTFRRKVIAILSRQGVDVAEHKSHFLQNDYYDTSDLKFEKHKIGYRVRGKDGQFEQTVKTAGSVQGGLHKRAEFNIPLAKDEPDLSLFKDMTWPEDWVASELNTQLVRQFSTNFTRSVFVVTLPEGEVEVVFDEGEVVTEKAKAPINEVELELLSGDVNALFVLADTMLDYMPMRLSDVTKAARGYQLLHGTSNKLVPLAEYIDLEPNTSVEDGLIAGLSSALAHWQLHEHLYIETGSIKMLGEVARGIRTLLQAINLYYEALPCSALDELRKSLSEIVATWEWQEDLQSLRYLQSKKSVLFKSLAKHPAMLSYLQGRQAGLLQAHAPQHMFYHQLASKTKLAIAKVIYLKPWRHNEHYQSSLLLDTATQWLSEEWRTARQHMPQEQVMGATDYLAVESTLRHTLVTGFLVADLFSSSRGRFRAPWLDLLVGIDELKALKMLERAVLEAEPEGKEDIQLWVREKIHGLVRVMERSRHVALQADTYW